MEHLIGLGCLVFFQENGQVKPLIPRDGGVFGRGNDVLVLAHHEVVFSLAR